MDDWAALQCDAVSVRTDVFVLEQNVPITLEIDEMDVFSLHAVVYDETGKAIGTGRLLSDGHIGRMAVRKIWRGIGIGSQVLQALMGAAQERGDQMVLINAQVQAVGFYARFGFVSEGEEFDDAGIPHILMRHVFFREGSM